MRKRRRKKKEWTNVGSEGSVDKKVVESEERQLIWFLVFVGLVIAGVLVPYFWIQSSKTFEYGGADWAIENHNGLEIFHGRFRALSGASLTYNIFLRNDPRQNNVSTIGSFDKFKGGGVVSMAPEVDGCRGGLSRIMTDLAGFLNQGVGIGDIKAGSTDKNVATESGRFFAQCNTVSDKTIIIIEIGDPMVVQDEKNPYCYTIYSENCNDVKSVEKFMLETVKNFRVSSGE